VAMTDIALDSYELGPIRPPSEAYSLLVRVTRNCPWNRCRFCPIYKGTKFELRPVEDIKRDITAARKIYDSIMQLAGKSGGSDNMRAAAAMAANSALTDAFRNVALWMYAGGEHAFLQDANTLIIKTPDLVEVIRFLKETFPGINRITTYARSKTAAQKKPAELIALREAGLARIHMGLESGCDAVLQFMDKGVTAAEHIDGGKNVVASGISLCTYIMPGAGGTKWWREHALETARVLNEIDPDFIRFRTLTVQPRMLLYQDVAGGAFIRATDEEIVEEIRLLIENLKCRSNLVSDHIMNLLPEIEGKLPEEKERILAVIVRFQSLPQQERDNYKLGRRLGIYNCLNDLNDTDLHGQVARMMERLGENGQGVSDELLYNLMERYI
jgi:hypothetical protein